MRIRSVEIDRDVGSAYVHFEPPAPGMSKRQVNLGDAVILDFAEDGSLVGVEILHPGLTAFLLREDVLRAIRAENVPVRM